MLKKIMSMFIACFIITACSASMQRLSHDARNPNSAFVHDMNEKTITIVHKADDSRFFATCGGVWIDKHTIITAAHCIDSEPVICSSDDGKTTRKCREHFDDLSNKVIFFFNYNDYVNDDIDDPHRAIVVDVDLSYDLALMTTLYDAPAIARIESISAPKGIPVHSVGHPNHVLFKHIIASIDDVTWVFRGNWRRPFHSIIIDTSVEGGTSGSGLWNERGKLIGVCNSRSSSHNISYYASYITINEFMH